MVPWQQMITDWCSCILNRNELSLIVSPWYAAGQPVTNILTCHSIKVHTTIHQLLECTYSIHYTKLLLYFPSIANNCMDFPFLAHNYMDSLTWALVVMKSASSKITILNGGQREPLRKEEYKRQSGDFTTHSGFVVGAAVSWANCLTLSRMTSMPRSSDAFNSNTLDFIMSLLQRQ